MGLTGINNFFNRLTGDWPLTGHNVPLSIKAFRKMFEAHPSFIDYFPFIDYLTDSKTFLFDDGISVGVVFRAFPGDTDGRSEDTVAAFNDKIDNALKQLTKHASHPICIQVFMEDRIPKNIAKSISDTLPDSIAQSKFTQSWLSELGEHYDMMRSSNGIFNDERISSGGGDEKGWRAIERMIHICIYRKAPEKVWSKQARYTPAQQLDRDTKSFLYALQNTGIKLQRYSDNDLRDWMLPWLTPKVPGFESPYAYMEQFPIPKQESLASWDLASQIIHYPPMPVPERDEASERGVIRLGDTYQRYITLQGLSGVPDDGLLTQDTHSEQSVIACKFDQMPSDTIFTWTIVPAVQDEVDRHIDKIHESARRTASEDAMDASDQASDAKTYRRRGAEIYQFQIGYFLRAGSLAELDDKRLNAESVMAQTPLRPIDPQYDLIADDAVIRNMPMVYDWEHDQKKGLRARLTYTAHIAATLPFFGRGLGGSFGHIMYRRDGQVFTYNPVKDKLRVAHKTLLGPTGSGKSATFATQTAESMAINRPRQIIIEKGNSFAPLMDYYEANEIKVARKQFTMGKDISFPPYYETAKALAEHRGEVVQDDDEDDEVRSYLGEMLNITKMMVTGGNPKTLENFTQSNIAALQTAMIHALENATERGDPHARPADVRESLLEQSKTETIEKIKIELREMADAMLLWTQGPRGTFFNTFGSGFSDKDDVTHIDLGMLTVKGNEDMLQVAILAIVYNITALGEKHQFSGRDIEVLVDEGHYIATNALAADSFSEGIKVWRKLKTWLTFATQQFKDMKDEAKTILAQTEFWTLLAMGPEETKLISKFRDLTDEQAHLIHQATKRPGYYVEGVILSESMPPALVRFIPPALGLALGQTDGDEKKARRDLMKKHNITELEAIYMVAESIKARRRAYSQGDEML